jgi:hypothetical protein
MGFLDRMKGAQEQAAEAMKGMGGSIGQMANPGAVAAERDKIMKLGQVGVETPATIDSMAATGKTQGLGDPEYEFEITVNPVGGEAYKVTLQQFLAKQVADQYKVGPATVKVDPDDPNSILLWGVG